jgi:hypothetical protein
MLPRHLKTTNQLFAVPTPRCIKHHEVGLGQLDVPVRICEFSDRAIFSFAAEHVGMGSICRPKKQ